MENAAAAVSKLFAKDPTPAQTEEESRTSKSTTPAATATATTSKTAKTAKTAPNAKAAPTTTAVTEKNVEVDADVDVDTEVAPAVEHTHVTKEHETREQTFIEKEKHQDHYHTTIQPLKETEVVPEKHEHVQETKHRKIELDDGAAKAKAKADLKAAGFKNTVDETQEELKTREAAQVDEHIHHHYHETIQPVIEKEVIVPSVTHKRIDKKELIHEAATYEGVTINEALPVEEFKKRKLDVEEKK